MSRRHRRRKRSTAGAIMGRLASTWIAHPLRTVFVGVLSLAALWVVAAKSLPYALAPAEPDAALALNPNNPVALITKAETLKKKLVELISVETERIKTGENNAQRDAGENTLSRLPEVKAAESGQEPIGEREILRGEIRNLALRAIANDPLNASAFRLLAEVTSSPDRVRLLMRQSLKRSRRESIAAFWLLNDSVFHKDFKSALDYSDILLRTRPALQKYVFGYLSFIADAPEARNQLIEKLKAGPKWRNDFFYILPSSTKNVNTPLALMTALQNSAKPMSEKEIAPYLNYLIRDGKVDLAYNAWLQFLPRPQLENLGLLTNASFQSKPSGLPFDWDIEPGVNAIAEIVPLVGGSAENVLHIAFQDGRIKFPEVSQILLLAPGRYRLEGKLRGAISGKRGLRWQLSCTSGARRVLAQTEMLLGKFEQWRIFTLEAEVPQHDDCGGQKLRLLHNSRSASEELLSGEVWFNDLHLERVLSETAQWAPAQ